MKNEFGVKNGTVEKSGSMRNHNETNSEQSSYSSSTSSSCCSSMGEGELKIYQAFIFSIPVFFTFVLLFSFYFFYLHLRRRRSRPPPSHLQLPTLATNQIFRAEQGLKKELREMLPIIVFMESFSVSDTQCSVCLGDYQAGDKLQQIPACGHNFHIDCIDQWLTAHTTCPLCRLSLLASAKLDILEEETGSSSPSIAESSEDPSIHNCNPSDDRTTSL